MQVGNVGLETEKKIERLDFRAFDLALAHEKLGEAVHAQVYRILNEKIKRENYEEFVSNVRKARLMASAIDQRIKSPHLMREIQKALIAYQDALHAWATGAKLDEYNHELFDGKKIDGLPISGQELALLLQTEQLGCQTGIIRDEDKAIWLWHAEEDVEPERGTRFDQTRIFSFCYEDKQIHSFIYPDLLPGPTFGWRNDSYVQAVDTIYVKNDTSENIIPPNIATWLGLCLGGEVQITEIVDGLSPFENGYAIVCVFRSSDKVVGEKVEFASHEMEYSHLSERYGDYLFQVNMITNRDSRLKKNHEKINETVEALMKQRINRTEDALEMFVQAQNKIGFLHRLLSSRDGGENAYANKDVKAHFLCRASHTGLDKWIGLGVAKEDDDLEQWK